MTLAEDICTVILRLIEQRFDEGLVAHRPVFVDITELPGEKYAGLWRVAVWGNPGEYIADVDVEATIDIEVLAKALTVFVTRTREEWIAEIPEEIE